MSYVEQLIAFFKKELTSPNLEKWSLEVLPWLPTALLIKTYLQNNVKPLLVTVRPYNGYTKRVYHERNIQDTEQFEVAVLGLEAPEYLEPALVYAKDAVVEQIKKACKKPPILVTVENYKNLDHMVSKVLILQTVIIVSMLHEN